jgi:hypothetical protein
LEQALFPEIFYRFSAVLLYRLYGNCCLLLSRIEHGIIFHTVCGIPLPLIAVAHADGLFIALLQ